MSSRPKLKRDEVERLRMQFMQVDTNKDGKIDHEEFKQFLKETFPYATPKELAEMTPKKLGDIETSEKIDFEQYVDFMSQDVGLRFDVKFIRLQKRTWEDKLGLAMYIPFLALFIYFLVTGKGLGSSYWLQKSVLEHLEGDEFENSPDLRYFKAFEDIGEVEEFWEWQMWPMVNTIWPPEGGEQKGNQPINAVNFPIGALKLRQIRAEGRECPDGVNNIVTNKQDMVPNSDGRKRDFRIRCFPELAEGNIDKTVYPVQTARYNNSFGTVEEVLSLDSSHFLDPWERETLFPAYQWRSAGDLSGSAASFFMGKVGIYPPDGYGLIIPFSLNRSTVLRIFSSLSEGIKVGGWTDPETGKAHPEINIPWIDHATRGVSVEFLVYNQNLDLVGKFQQFVEITASGLLIPTHYVLTFQFFNLSDHSAGYFLLLVIFICTILGQCFSWFNSVSDQVNRHVLEEGRTGILVHLEGLWKVLTGDFWVVFDFVNLSLFLAVWGIRFYWMSLGFTSNSILVLNDYPKEWETVGEMVVILTHIDAVNALLTFLRVFYYLRLNSQLNLLTKTIAKAKAELMGIVFIFLIVFIGFALMAYVVFGTVLEGYRDFSTTVSSLLRMLLGDFDYDELKEERRVFSPILFTIFNVMANFLLLNMVIAVLNQAFESVQNEKYNPGKLGLLLEHVNSQDHLDPDDTFSEKVYRKQKGCQNWIRGTSAWRELVYSCNVFMLYTTSKDELPGGEDEWDAKMREVVEYNPRTFWALQEQMMFYQKRSLSFTDKLRINPMPLKFHLLDEFGDDLPHVIDLSAANNNFINPIDLGKHDLVVSPSYCIGLEPKGLLLELMDFFHTWRSEYASNYVSIEEDEEGNKEAVLEDEMSQGMALRGSEEAEEVIAKMSAEWWNECQGKENEMANSDEHTRYEKLRRQAEKEEFEQAYERKQLEEQAQYIENLQHQLDDMHSTVAGKVQDGSFRIDAKDVLIPTEITVNGCDSITVGGHIYDVNGNYTRKGMYNGKPYWKKLHNSQHEKNLCILWGEGMWWIGKPRTHPRDRVCVPSLLTWEDTETKFPPKGGVTDGSLVATNWESVMDGGIGTPPVLDYEVLSDSTALKVTVTGATTHQANGVYTLQPDQKNGKSYWRKRYQVVTRYFRVEPFDHEEEKMSALRSRLRDIRDSVAASYNVTLRVPGVMAAVDRRMELEGDWQMCLKAQREIIIPTVREVYQDEGLNPSSVDTDDYLLPEVFIEGGKEVDEDKRLLKVESTLPSNLQGPEEWTQVGSGYDLDLMWKEGRWVIARRLAASSKGFIGFHESPPKVNLMLATKVHPGISQKESRAKWEQFVQEIPSLMAKYSVACASLLGSSNSTTPDGIEHIGQEDRVHMRVVPRIPQPGADERKQVKHYFESNLAWEDERIKGSEDALLFGIGFEEKFPDRDGTTAEVKMPGSLRGTWLECTILDEPDQDVGPTAKYRVSVDMERALRNSPLVRHKLYLKDLERRGKLGSTRTLLVTRDSLRKRVGQDAESWVSRFASWVNNPHHEIHKEYAGLLSASQVLNPSPQTLYCCNDPDTRSHPPLFKTEWKRSDNSVDPDTRLVGTTRVHIKKVGLGGLDQEPHYLGVHHAYIHNMWELTEGTATVYSGHSVSEASATPEIREAGSLICASPVTDNVAQQWLQLFNVQEGTSLDLWVKKTPEWKIKKQERGDELPPLWTRDARDEESLYVCAHKWKNEATIWELERAPEKGTKFFLRKAVTESFQEDVEKAKKVMLSSNYPLTYKGDGKKRYLSVFETDRRTGGQQQQGKRRKSLFAEDLVPSSFWVCSHENREAGEDQEGTDSSMWEVVHFPNDVEGRRDGLWWQRDHCIIDWMRNDMRTESGAIAGRVPEIPKGTRWSANVDTPSRASDWELAPREELEQRAAWYSDNWRLARTSFAEQAYDPVTGQPSKHNLRQLKIIDAERERQTHRVLIKKANPQDTPAPEKPLYLSVWKNYPEGSFFEGVWQTHGFVTQGAEEHRLKQQGQSVESFLPDGDLVWDCGCITESPAAIAVRYKNTILDGQLTVISPTKMVVVVGKWREMELESEFEFHRRDDLMRDANSHYVIATEEFRKETHTLWEIEPIQDLDDSIDTSVKSAVLAQQKGLHKQFRDLIHEEMTFLLKTVMPNVLLDELGPNQLVQTLNFKIRSESQTKEDTAMKGLVKVKGNDDEAGSTDDATDKVSKWQKEAAVATSSTVPAAAVALSGPSEPVTVHPQHAEGGAGGDTLSEGASGSQQPPRGHPSDSAPDTTAPSSGKGSTSAANEPHS